MARFNNVALLAAAAVLAAVVATASAGCSSCSFSLQAGPTTYDFDLSQACTSTGYSFVTKHGFKYTMNICGDAPGTCTPKDWKDPVNTGVAIQSFDNDYSCHVMGTGAPKWSFMDPSNPTTGGLVATFDPVPVSVSADPYWCPALPDGSMQPRSISYNITCDPVISHGAQVTMVTAAKMDNYCAATAVFSSGLACGKAADWF